MKRRRLLALSGTIAGSLLAGCLGGGDSPGSNAETQTETTATKATATPSPTPRSTQRPTTESSPSTATESTDSPGPTRSTTAEDRQTTRSATRSPTGTDESALHTHQLTVTDRACGSPTDEGTIGFENDRITLTGTITGKDGCATAVLEDVTDDRAADRLRVLVATETESGGGAICTQCLTEIDYEASVALENGTPGTVVLIHRGTTGETRVAIASL